MDFDRRIRILLQLQCLTGSQADALYVWGVMRSQNPIAHDILQVSYNCRSYSKRNRDTRKKYKINILFERLYLHAWATYSFPSES